MAISKRIKIRCFELQLSQSDLANMHEYKDHSTIEYLVENKKTAPPVGVGRAASLGQCPDIMNSNIIISRLSLLFYTHFERTGVFLW